MVIFFDISTTDEMGQVWYQKDFSAVARVFPRKYHGKYHAGSPVCESLNMGQPLFSCNGSL